MHGASMAKINSHPSGRIQLLCAIYANAARGGFVLRLPCEHVVIAALAVMEERANRTEELQCRRKFVLRGIWQQRFRCRPSPLLVNSRKQRHPAGYVVVTQASGSLFDMRFQVKHRVSVLRVAGTGHFRKLLNDVVPFPQKEFRQELVVQAEKQLRVSSHRPAIEQRNSELHVLGIELLALRQRACGRPQLHAQVPKFLAKSPDWISQAIFSASVGMQKEDVNIRMRKQNAPAEAAERHQRKVFGISAPGANDFAPQA